MDSEQAIIKAMTYTPKLIGEDLAYVIMENDKEIATVIKPECPTDKPWMTTKFGKYEIYKFPENFDQTFKYIKGRCTRRVRIEKILRQKTDFLKEIMEVLDARLPGNPQ